MNVLVTGGTGYLGRAIVAALLRHGHRPTVFARRAHAATDLAGAADRRRRPRSRRASSRPRAAWTASSTPPRSSASGRRTGPTSTASTSADSRPSSTSAPRHGTPRLVVTSSFLALPPAGRRRPLEANDYQRSKVRAREVVRAAVSRGVPIVSVTPGVVYGPGIESEGQSGRANDSRPSRRPAARHHRRATEPGRSRTSRTWPTRTCGRWSAATRATTTSPAAKTPRSNAPSRSCGT